MGRAPRMSEAELRRLRSDESPEKERDVQSALMDWAAAHSSKWPALDLLFAVPNGQFRPGTAPEPGLRPGVPDLCLPHPTDDFPGLFLELKRDGAQGPRDSQRKWLISLLDQGYAVTVAYGYDEATRILSLYCSGHLSTADLYTP